MKLKDIEIGEKFNKKEFIKLTKDKVYIVKTRDVITINPETRIKDIK